MPTLPAALLMLAALTLAACQTLVIRPPGDAAGFYASPNGRDDR